MIQSSLMLKWFGAFLLFFFCGPAFSQWQWHMEAGVFQNERNKVQIPNGSLGDRFKITDVGKAPFFATRLTLGWFPAKNHEFQLVYAPFSYSETGTFQNDIRFNDATFSQGEPVDVRYQFSSYRLRYLYHWVNNALWTLDLGGTLFVRDASIRLRQQIQQSVIFSEDEDLGFVPLFAIRSTYRLSNAWQMLADVDFAIAPQGRAIDLALLAQYEIEKNWVFSTGYRTIEGGADNDNVYNFAWFNGAIIKATYTW